MNFTKFGKSGPNLQRLNLKNLKREGVDQDGSGLWVQRTFQESWFGIKTQRQSGTCFENH